MIFLFDSINVELIDFLGGSSVFLIDIFIEMISVIVQCSKQLLSLKETKLNGGVFSLRPYWVGLGSILLRIL